MLEQTVRRIQVDLLLHLDSLAVFCSEHEALVRIQVLRKWERRRRLRKGLGNQVLLIIRIRKSLNGALPGAYRGAEKGQCLVSRPDEIIEAETHKVTIPERKRPDVLVAVGKWRGQGIE